MCVCVCAGWACERLFGGSRGGEGPEAGMHVNTGRFPGLTYGFTDLKGWRRATSTVEGPPWDCRGILRVCERVCVSVSRCGLGRGVRIEEGKTRRGMSGGE